MIVIRTDLAHPWDRKNDPDLERRIRNFLRQRLPNLGMVEVHTQNGTAFIANPRVSVSISIADLAEVRLQTSPYSSIRKILCECDEGMLVLRGRLPTFFHKQIAQAALADIPGVRQIVNQIEVLEPTNQTCVLSCKSK